MSHVWAPQPGPQLAAVEAKWINELFYGGARGGGKSDYLLGDFLQDVFTYKERWRGLLVRQSYPELEELIARSHDLYPPTGAIWGEQKKTWTWPNGAFMRMRSIENARDAKKLQGHQYAWIGWDELPQWPDDRPYRMLFACNRSAKGVEHKRIRASGNPGGVGHHWVKNRFIDANPLGFEIQTEALRSGVWERMFIPAKVWDNKILLKNDPNYIQALEMVGSPELVRAWLEGDWNVITGAYFPEFSTDKHIIKPFEIPPHWFRVFAHDWGSASPFANVWGAVSDGDCGIPAGAIVIYRELYGASGPNQGLKMRNRDIAALTLSKESHDEKVSLRVADPACFQEDGGPSIAEDFRAEGLAVRAADNKRIPGWSQVRSRLIGQDERPMIYFFDTCRDLIRTLPALQHDDKKPEDVNTEGDDHLADALRYLCMSRPYMRPKPTVEKPKYLGDMTLNELWANQGKRPRKRRI